MISKHSINSSSPFSNNTPANTRKTKMNKIVEQIKGVDENLSRAVGKFVQKYNKTPTELDLIKDSNSTIPLIDLRKKLVKQYHYLKQEAQFAENTYNVIRGDNPITRAKKSFQGITLTSSPMEGNKSYIDTFSSPTIRRVGTNSNKQGTLWDPRFNSGDITVNPGINRYYQKLMKGYIN